MTRQRQSWGSVLPSQALHKAIAAVRPGMRFREIGDITSQHVGQHKYQVN